MTGDFLFVLSYRYILLLNTNETSVFFLVSNSSVCDGFFFLLFPVLDFRAARGYQKPCYLGQYDRLKRKRVCGEIPGVGGGAVNCRTNHNDEHVAEKRDAHNQRDKEPLVVEILLPRKESIKGRPV